MENNEYQNQVAEMAPVEPASTPMSASAPAPKKDSKAALYIVIATLAMAVVGLAVALVIVLTSGEKSGGASKADEPTEKVSEVEKRDEERKKKLNNIFRAANDYQVNNRGKTPWASKKTDGNFVKRYIDARCKMISQEENSERYGYYVDEKYECDEGADEWLDPDGSPYGITVVDNIEYRLMDNGSNDASIDDYFSKWPNGHKIVVVPNSYCSEVGGSVTYTSSSRLYSLSMLLEGGDIACIDNH